MMFCADDFLDYVIMLCLCNVVVWALGGGVHLLSQVMFLLSLFFVYSFYVRHGVALCMPVLFKEPMSVVYAACYLVPRWSLCFTVSLFVVAKFGEGMLITSFQWLPHASEKVRLAMLLMAGANFTALLIVRVFILVQHWRKAEHVERVLRDSSFRRYLRGASVYFHIVHCFMTGVYGMVLSWLPWVWLIRLVPFSVLTSPIISLGLLKLTPFFGPDAYLSYYILHWQYHNSRFQFIYFHGSHHDCIPSSLGASDFGDGFLGSIFMNMANCGIWLNGPLNVFSFFFQHSHLNMLSHQYIPGVYPYCDLIVKTDDFHMEHHYLRMEPLGLGTESWYPDKILDNFCPSKESRLWVWFAGHQAREAEWTWYEVGFHFVMGKFFGKSNFLFFVFCFAASFGLN